MNWACPFDDRKGIIDEIFGQIPDTAISISDPFEQAFFVTVHLPYLQPFEDVNKRVSRLAANIPLIHHKEKPEGIVVNYVRRIVSSIYVRSLL